MPKRTTLFQEVVEIIHRHMADGATVEASAMLVSRSTGAPREVDVVIRASQAGYDVVVSIEAVARSRKADRQWVDQMVGKHADLPTSKLVLVSERGFTHDARAAALANDALPLAPTDLSGTHPDEDVVRAVPTLWPKVVTTPETLRVKWTDEDVPAGGWGERSPLVGIDDGRIVGTLMDLVERAYRDHLPELMDQIGLAEVKQDAVRRFVLVLEPQAGDDLHVSVDGVPRTIFVINDSGRGYSVRQVTATGKGEVKVSKVPLLAGRLGQLNVTFAYGEGTVGGRDAMLITEREDDAGQLTIRVRPETNSTLVARESVRLRQCLIATSASARSTRHSHGRDRRAV